MLQSLSASPQDLVEPPEQSVGLDHYLAIAKRRLFYFLIPFLLALLLGSLLIAVQRPIYRAEGKILVESQDIPKDLVKPTITDTASQRIQIIQQRSMTRDNLLRIVRRFGLFPQEQRWMSESQLLDLMKARTKLEVIDLDLPMLQWQQQLGNSLAFTLSFEYEVPGVAARVANEFLTGILNDDAVNRNNRAAETTRFMEQEVKRLQGAVATTEGKITEAELKPPDPVKQLSEQYRIQRDELTRLRLDLTQKTATYSSAHPEVKSLKKKIEALEKVVANAPKPAEPQVDNGIGVLRSQLTATEVQLDDANRKLADARLGESLESNQQSERLQVIEQPAVPQAPVKPKRLKLFAVVFALSAMAGLAVAMMAETFDKSIHGSQDLAGIVDSRLVLAIPYIATAAEGRQKKTRIMLLLGTIAVVILGALAVALYLGVELPSWGDQAWLDGLTHLSK